MSNALIKFHTRLHQRLTEDRGATMVEYGLIVAVIALVAVVGAGVLGTQLSALFSRIGNSLTSYATP